MNKKDLIKKNKKLHELDDKLNKKTISESNIAYGSKKRNEHA